jgi:hypothetical protein
MSANPDRLYELLPAIYRLRDAERGWPLRALLRVIGEQLDLVEEDVAQLYENWFIETCDDWVVPYLGDLVGHQPVSETRDPGALAGPLLRALVPRREVANTVRYRRRKGTLALLEELGRDVADWPARAVELARLVDRTASVRLAPGIPQRGGTVELRRGDVLERLDGPFDDVPHTVDVRRVGSSRTRGRYHAAGVGLFIWRLRPYSITATPAYNLEQVSAVSYTFSVLGNDTPLFHRPRQDSGPIAIAGALDLPTSISRRRLASSLDAYYGPDRSLAIWDRPPVGDPPPPPISAERLVVTDLGDWRYQPHGDQVAVDPVLGRIAFPLDRPPEAGVWVSYHHGFSADVGGGEYARPMAPVEGTLYRVGPGWAHDTLQAALAAWYEDAPDQAVIELARGQVFTEEVRIRLRRGQHLVIRAAERARPVIRLLDRMSNLPDPMRITVEDSEQDGEETGAGPCPEQARLTLDGLLIAGRGVHVRGPLAELCIRHCTLVPGWSLDPDCQPQRPNEPSLELYNTHGRVHIERSIVGTIQVHRDAVRTDPIPIAVIDSILDATDQARDALGAPGRRCAHAVLTARRSTIIGRVDVHACELAENSLFLGHLLVARRQRGCIRFCYVPPGSRTPRRYHCQPDEVVAGRPAGEREAEATRVRPRFDSTRYGTPTYCRLAPSTAPEILRGADDRSEMGVFHHLYQSQRAAALQARLDEYTPAGMEAGLIDAIEPAPSRSRR